MDNEVYNQMCKVAARGDFATKGMFFSPPSRMWHLPEAGASVTSHNVRAARGLDVENKQGARDQLARAIKTTRNERKTSRPATKPKTKQDPDYLGSDEWHQSWLRGKEPGSRGY